jgi:hypothetical protein
VHLTQGFLFHNPRYLGKGDSVSGTASA